MAQIKTIDGEIHNVKETLEEINEIIKRYHIIKLSLRCTISGWKSGEETTEFVYEPVYFMRNSIMMYY